MFSVLNIGTVIREIRKRHQILNLYYPRDVYDPLARREMKMILTQFNKVFYGAYPNKLKENRQIAIDYQPHKYVKKHEVQRELTLYKTKKVRKKELMKIESFLQLKYMIEAQLEHYNFMLQKAQRTRQQLSNEQFSSYFPQLFEERMLFLNDIEAHCLKKTEELIEEKSVYEQSIYELVHYPDNFLKDAGRLIGSVVAGSVKHVVDTVEQKIRRK